MGFVNSFVEFNRFTNSPLANYKNVLYNLPFNMNTFYQLWGTKTPAEAKAEIERQRAEVQIDDPKNLEEQALSLVGKDIYEKLIKGYTEKQWGKSPRDLPAFIIKRIPLRYTLIIIISLIFIRVFLQEDIMVLYQNYWKGVRCFVMLIF